MILKSEMAAHRNIESLQKGDSQGSDHIKAMHAWRWWTPGAGEVWDHLAGRCIQALQRDLSGCLILVYSRLLCELRCETGHLTEVGAILNTEARRCSKWQVLPSSAVRGLRFPAGVLPILAQEGGAFQKATSFPILRWTA